MKIVIIEKEESLKVGGIIIHNQRLANFLRHQGHDVKIIRFTNEESKDRNLITIPYYLAEKRSFILLPLENTRELLTRALKKIKPDVVHFCIGISPFDLFIPALCHSLNIPIVGIWHTDLAKERTSFELLAKSIYLAYLPVCKELDSLIVFTRRMKNFYVNKGLNKNRVKIIPNGVDSKLYSPGITTYKKKLALKNTVIFLGRLTLVKNPELLIEAFRKANVPQSKLLIVGTGDLESELKEKYAFDKRIIFTGLVKNEAKKIDLLRSANIFVLPSKNEGMSLSLLEAMSCSLATIVSDVGGSADIVGRTGIVLKEAHLENELPVVIKILLDHPDFQKSLGKAARKRIIMKFNEEKTFTQYFALYEKVVLSYHRFGPPEAFSQELYTNFNRKFKNLWEKAKDFSENYFLG